MALLHLVSRSPYESHGLADCLRRAGAQDAILLVENGVYAARGAKIPPGLQSSQSLFALREDLESRGIGEHELLPEVTLVDYPGFVDLVTQYNHCFSW